MAWFDQSTTQPYADSHEKETAGRDGFLGKEVHPTEIPYKVSSAVEENYQRSHTRTRNMKKRYFAFGVLISLGDDAVLPHVAVATVVLHIN